MADLTEVVAHAWAETRPEVVTPSVQEHLRQRAKVFLELLTAELLNAPALREVLVAGQVVAVSHGQLRTHQLLEDLVTAEQGTRRMLEDTLSQALKAATSRDGALLGEDHTTAETAEGSRGREGEPTGITVRRRARQESATRPDEAAVDEVAEVAAPPPQDDAQFPLTSPILGRNEAVEWLVRGLRAQRVRLWWIHGLPGIGCSAIAMTSIQRLRAEGCFADGIIHLVCEAQEEILPLLARLFQRLGVTISPGETVGPSGGPTSTAVPTFRADRPSQPPPAATPIALSDQDMTRLAALTRSVSQGRDLLALIENVPPDPVYESMLRLLADAGFSVVVTSHHRPSARYVPATDQYALQPLSRPVVVDLFAHSLGYADVREMSDADQHAAEAVVTVLEGHPLAIVLAAAYAATTRREIRVLADELRTLTQIVTLPDAGEPGAVDLVVGRSVDTLSDDARRVFIGLAAIATTEWSRPAAIVLGLGLLDTSPTLAEAAAAAAAAVDELIQRGLLEASQDPTQRQTTAGRAPTAGRGVTALYRDGL